MSLAIPDLLDRWAKPAGAVLTLAALAGGFIAVMGGHVPWDSYGAAEAAETAVQRQLDKQGALLNFVAEDLLLSRLVEARRKAKANPDDDEAQATVIRLQKQLDALDKASGP